MTDEELSRATGISVPVLKAIRIVESGGNARAVRFETHVFLRRTGRTVEGHDRSAFERAFAIDPAEAVNSTSWGWWQVMGFHGFSEMYGGPSAAVRAFDADPQDVSRRLFLRFMQNHPEVVHAARAGDWYGLASRYNGCSDCDRYVSRFLAAYEDALREGGAVVAGGSVLFLLAGAGALFWFWSRRR